MALNIGFGYGLQRLLDAHYNYARTGHAVWLRIRNFPDIQNQRYAQLGFSIASSAGGTTDIPILPQPSVTMISLHNIGASMGKLRFGAREFGISASFTDAQVAAGTFTSQDLVWADPKVVGLVCDKQLFSIENINHEEIAGRTISWQLVCNAAENK